MRDILERIFSEHLRIKSHIVSVDKLHGDASYRTYYRAGLSDKSSYIIMQMPKGKSSVSEEITNFKGKHTELPFINVDNFLKDAGLPVPMILYYSESDSILVIEDLGDILMAKQVVDADLGSKISWYKKAIELLVRMQRATIDADKSKCVALQRSFDDELLNWEFDHFLEYGIEARFNKKVSAEDKKIFSEQTRAITKEIKLIPSCFTHRDFQSRNLIFHDNTLYMIDFQDALMGPKVYDLVALLRDSYVKLSDTELNELLDCYAKLSDENIDVLRNAFDLVTVQRKLKDTGRFVYIEKVKGNSNFLQYVPASIGYAKAALSRLKEYKQLNDMISRYNPEWK